MLAARDIFFSSPIGYPFDIIDICRVIISAVSAGNSPSLVMPIYFVILKYKITYSVDVCLDVNAELLASIPLNRSYINRYIVPTSTVYTVVIKCQD
jgi:hypothetical protein